MISVSDAQAQILARITVAAPPELIPVAGALGRVLAEDVRSTMDVPPTDNSAVDGYAVGAADIPARRHVASSTWWRSSPRARCSPTRSGRARRSAS